MMPHSLQEIHQRVDAHNRGGREYPRELMERDLLNLIGGMQAATVLLRYPASADGPGDEFVQECRAWLDRYDSNTGTKPSDD